VQTDMSMPRAATTAALAAAIGLAAPGAAAAKDFDGGALCGAGACHRVAPAPLRAGLEDLAPAAAPRRAEPYLTRRVRAPVSSHRTALVETAVWLPRSGRLRATSARAWTRPALVLDRALRRAARGLRPRPAAALGDVSDAPARARVVDVFAPAGSGRGDGGGRPGAVALAAAAAAAGLAAATALAVRRARRRDERGSATLARRPR
jgi:hypothetical protein